MPIRVQYWQASHVNIWCLHQSAHMWFSDCPREYTHMIKANSKSENVRATSCNILLFKLHWMEFFQKMDNMMAYSSVTEFRSWLHAIPRHVPEQAFVLASHDRRASGTSNALLNANSNLSKPTNPLKLISSQTQASSFHHNYIIMHFWSPETTSAASVITHGLQIGCFSKFIQQRHWNPIVILYLQMQGLRKRTTRTSTPTAAGRITDSQRLPP